MRYLVTIREISTNHSWKERYEIDGSPEVYLSNLITDFNSTLTEGESPRALVDWKPIRVTSDMSKDQVQTTMSIVPQSGVILGVAIKYDDKIYRLPKPNRHADVIEMMVKEYGIKPPINPGNEDSGFYTSEGKYLTRKEAYTYAVEVLGVEPEFPSVLYSEDLW